MRFLSVSLRMLCGIGSLLCAAGIAYAEPLTPLPINPDAKGLLLDPQVQFLRDDGGSLSFEDVSGPESSARFKPLGTPSINKGFTPVVYWYRIALQNTAPRGRLGVTDFALEVGWPPLDHADFYVLVPGEAVREVLAGRQRPPDATGIQHRNYVLPLRLPPGKPVTLYLRVQIDGAHQVPLRLWSGRAFAHKTAVENLRFGMIYGILLVMVIYNLLIYFAVRDRAYLYYLVFIFMVGTLQANLDGFLRPFFWSVARIALERSIPLQIGLATVFGSLFIQSSLETQRYSPRLHRALRVVMFMGIAASLLPAVLPYLWSTFMNALLGAGLALLGAVVICKQSLEGRRTARLYLFAWSLLFVGILAKVLEVNALLPISVFTTYALHIGLCFMVTLLSLALADRITSERRERDRLEREHAAAELAAKNEFLAKMSHELRTPMNAVVGFTDLALRSSSDTQRVEHLGEIDRAARALTHILDDVLDLTRLETGRLTLQSLDFEPGTLLTRVIARIKPAAEEREIGIQLIGLETLPQVLIGDGARLEQVLTNLVDNAAKFTEHGSIELRVSEKAREPGHALIEFAVRDTGIGISREQLAKLFTPFSQGDQSITRKYGGTGLGLVLCKQLVERMGGTLSVESEPGHGSEFRFALKFGIGEAQAMPARKSVRAVSASAGLGGRRVLLVEDNATNRRLAGEILRDAGIAVDVAEHGAEAVAAVQRQHYDAVLMDVQMPVMDGFEATRTIRKLSRLGRLPIIAMTANAMAEDRKQAAVAGMDDFLPKPIDSDQVLGMLSKWLGRAGVGAPVQAAVVSAKAEPKPSALPDVLPGIDLAGALRRLGGRHVLLIEMLHDMQQEQVGFTQRLREQIASGDLKTAQRNVHSLKGVASNLGCDTLAQAAVALENVLRDPQKTGLSDKLIAVELAQDQIAASLASLPKPAKGPAATADISSESLDARLSALTALAQNQDFAATAQFEALQTALRERYPGAEIDALAKAFHDFDFTGAARMLARLQNTPAHNTGATAA